MRLPIRVRLTLAFAMAMTVVLAALGGFVYVRVGHDLTASIDLGLRSRAQVMVDAIHAGGDSLLGAGGAQLIDPDESFAQIVDPSGRVLQATATTSGAPLLTSETLRDVRGPAFFERTISRIDTDPLRLLAVPVVTAGGRVIAVAGATLGDRRDALLRLVVAFGIGGPAALLLVAVAGWLLIGAALRPVERMRQEASAVSVSDPDRRLPVPPTKDELGRLGETLNTMLDRLQASFERERRFVDDASHELRTPLAILKMELDLALARARTPEELKAALSEASVETDRLVRLAEDLLVLARAEGGNLPVHREPVDLPELLQQVRSAYEHRAGAAGVRIEVDAEGTVQADPARIRQAVENLLENALRHSPRGGRVGVRARREGTSMAISVEDPGPGFPASFLGRAFEPFARSDAEDGDGPGAGLGLAIVRRIGEAHGGSARAENLPAGGARVTITLRD